MNKHLEIKTRFSYCWRNEHSIFMRSVKRQVKLYNTWGNKNSVVIYSRRTRSFYNMGKDVWILRYNCRSFCVCMKYQSTERKFFLHLEIQCIIFSGRWPILPQGFLEIHRKHFELLCVQTKISNYCWIHKFYATLVTEGVITLTNWLKINRNKETKKEWRKESPYESLRVLMRLKERIKR